jgi:quinol monooxygenase YgiN
MDAQVICVTVIQLKPGLDELLLSELALLIEAARQLPGCLSFDLYRLIKEPGVIVLHETWETQEAYQGFAHSPLRGELMSLLSRSLMRPIETWHVEELCC